jgi:uncharacterized protein YecE (DUF72 family)
VSASGLYVGCAGWSLPRAEWDHFPSQGSHLERYATRFPAVEIDSSFYRTHRPATYARWAASVPPFFRFALKLPRTITHEAGLRDTKSLLDAFLAGALSLGPQLGCLLMQLPPSLEFIPEIVERFLVALRDRHSGHVVAEPRHPGWFVDQAEQLLQRFQVARVAADPAPVPAAASPGGWPPVVYYRLHGSPRMYYSSYSPNYLAGLAARLTSHARPETPVWCIFDNTALGAATSNALELLRRLGQCGSANSVTPSGNSPRKHGRHGGQHGTAGSAQYSPDSVG